MSRIRLTAQMVQDSDAMIDAAQTDDAIVALCQAREEQIEALLGLILGETGAPILLGRIEGGRAMPMRPVADVARPPKRAEELLWDRIKDLIRRATLERAISRNMENTAMVRDDAMGRYARLTDQLMSVLDDQTGKQLLAKIDGRMRAEVA